MRLDPTAGMSAEDLVATSSERDLADLIGRFGEEPLARKIAAKIAAARSCADQDDGATCGTRSGGLRLPGARFANAPSDEDLPGASHRGER
jgi:hypothetical protein